MTKHWEGPEDFPALWDDKRITLARLCVVFDCERKTLRNRARELGLAPRAKGPRSDLALYGGRWVPAKHGILHWHEEGF